MEAKLLRKRAEKIGRVIAIKGNAWLLASDASMTGARVPGPSAHRVPENFDGQGIHGRDVTWLPLAGGFCPPTRALCPRSTTYTKANEILATMGGSKPDLARLLIRTFSSISALQRVPRAE